MPHQVVQRLPAGRAVPEAPETDAQLLEHVGRGVPDSAKSFSVLYSRHEAMVHRTVQVLLGRKCNAEDVLDVAADVWVRIWRSASAFRGDSQFGTWIYRIARSTLIDRVRRQKGVNLLFVTSDELEQAVGRSAEEEASPEELVDRARLVDVLRQCIGELPETNRIVVELSYVQGLSMPEIARHLQVLEGTVKSRLHYAKQRLREIIRHYGAERYFLDDVDLLLFQELTPQQVSRLEARGIHTLAALSDLSWEELVEALEPVAITEERARSVILQARRVRFDWKPDGSLRLVRDLTPQQLSRLEARGFETLAQLSDLSWEKLVEALDPVAITEERARSVILQARAEHSRKRPTPDRGI